MSSGSEKFPGNRAQLGFSQQQPGTRGTPSAFRRFFGNQAIARGEFFTSGGPVGYTLTAQGGAYALTGGGATLTRSRLLTATGGTYAITGQNAGLSRNRKLTASGGAYAYTGQQVTITYTPAAVSYVLTAQGGAYTLAGQQAVLLRPKRIVAQGGAYAVTGASAVVKRDRYLAASGGAYAVTGAPAVVSWSGTPPGGINLAWLEVMSRRR